MHVSTLNAEQISLAYKGYVNIFVDSLNTITFGIIFGKITWKRLIAGVIVDILNNNRKRKC